MQEMFDSAICARYVTIFSGSLVKVGAVIEFTKTPWQGDPRINIQNHKGKTKAYQVKQVLLAIERSEVGYGLEK
jgi:hypothetical protein